MLGRDADSPCDTRRAAEKVDNVSKCLHGDTDDTIRISIRQDETYRAMCHKSVMTDSQGERLQRAREDAGYETAADAARAFGWNEITYRAHENGGRGLKADVVKRYAKAFRVSESWLFSGSGPMRTGLVSSFDPDQQEADYNQDSPKAKSSTGHGHELTPGAIVEVETRAGAGAGGYLTQGWTSDGRTTYEADAVRAEWILPQSFVRDELHLTFGKTEIIGIRGDSMEPDLSDGDRVLIDRTDTNLRQGGIFAVSDNGEIIIKQVELIRDSDPLQILCTSRNERYRPITLTLDDGTFVIGRVAARISRM
ncbi:LexA family transcriptional regulator [Pseudochelatococcus sp. B33]